MEDVSRSVITDIIKVKTREKNYHSNSIINSRQEYSVLERKMILLAINQLDISTKNVQRDLFNDICFKIPVSAFGEDYSFKTLKIAINKITNRSITGGDNKKQHAFSINPFPFAELKNGVVELVMYSKAVPLFMDLKTHGYTSYELNIALSLKSVYSQRLYELLGRFKDTHQWHIEIEKLKFLLGIDKDKSFNGPLGNGKIKATVIEPARIELAEKTDIEFTYEFVKEGRKFVAIDFTIYTKKLIKHIEAASSKQDAIEILEQVAEASQGQQTAFLYGALTEYQFSQDQQKRIFDNPKYQVKFIEIHTQIKLGVIKVETTPTRLMAWHLRQLGWK